MSELHRERILVTLWYIALFCVLLFLFHFSAGIALRQAFFSLSTQKEQYAILETQFTHTLYYFESFLAVTFIFLAYFLSGKTLRPIQTMREKQEDFISDASHELRAPITFIKRSAEHILHDEKNMSKKHVETYTAILNEAQHMEQMVEGLLTFVKSSDHIKMHHWALIPLHEVLAECVINITPLARSKLLRLTNEPFDEVFIEGERDKLKRLIMLLLDNAVKYTPPAGKVHVTLEKTPHRVHIVITDSGYGIPQEEIHHIFDRFYRIRNHAKAIKGTGLGLSIAKAIVEHHSGSITVQSEPDKGSTFTITLPRN